MVIPGLLAITLVTCHFRLIKASYARHHRWSSFVADFEALLCMSKTSDSPSPRAALSPKVRVHIQHPTRQSVHFVQVKRIFPPKFMPHTSHPVFPKPRINHQKASANCSLTPKSLPITSFSPLLAQTNCLLSSPLIIPSSRSCSPSGSGKFIPGSWKMGIYHCSHAVFDRWAATCILLSTYIAHCRPIHMALSESMSAFLPRQVLDNLCTTFHLAVPDHKARGTRGLCQTQLFYGIHDLAFGCKTRKRKRVYVVSYH